MSGTTLNQEARIFIVDDDDGARSGLQDLLAACGYQTELFCSADQFLERLPVEGPCCMVLDMQMPGMSGLELQEELAARRCKIPIVFLTAFGEVPTTVRAMKSGAEDFLPKLANEDELLDAVQRGVDRSFSILEDEHQHAQVRQCAASLTPREREVCAYLVAGLLNKQIAARLDISERTVKAHKAKVLGKFNVHSVAELVRCADKAGIEPCSGGF